MRNFLVAVILGQCALASADVLPLDSGYNSSEGSETAIWEENRNFALWNEWVTTDWTPLGANSYSAPANSNSGVVASTQGDYQNAVLHGVQGAFQAVLPSVYEAVRRGVTDAGTSHHNGSLGVLVPPNLSQGQIEPVDYNYIMPAEQGGTAYQPRSDAEKKIFGTSGIDGGSVMSLASAHQAIGMTGAPVLSPVSSYTAGTVSVLSFGTIPGLGAVTVDLTTGLGAAIPFLRAVMLAGLALWFAVRVVRLPAQYL